MLTDTGKVLVVDDEEIVCQSFQRILSEAGYEVHAERNGRDALAAFRARPFDVVLTDLKIPDMDGLEIARAMKAARPDVPVTIITGYGTPESERAAVKLGVFKYLNKPLAPDDLCMVTAEALASTARAATAEAVAGPTIAEVMVSASPVPCAATDRAEAAAEIEGTEPTHGTLKAIGMLAIAPILGLAYVIFLPFVGFGMLAVLGTRSLATRIGLGDRG